MKQSFVILYLFLFCWFSGTVWGQEANDFGSGYPYSQSFNKNEYKGSAYNFTALQDLRGLIYVGNQEGLFEYDGVRWRHIKLEYESGVYSLAINTRGRIYVGGQSELGYLKPDTNKNFVGNLVYKSLTSALPVKFQQFAQVWSCHAIGNKVYFQTDLFLAEWDETTQKIQVWEPITNFFLSWKVGNRLLVHDKQVGLHELIDGQLQLLPNGHRLASKRVMTVLPYDSDQLLIGTEPDGFLIYSEKQFLPFATEADEYLRNNQLYFGCELSGNQYALGTLYGGLVIISRRGRLVQVLNENNGLTHPQVKFILPDKEGGLWLILGNGLTRVESPRVLSYFGEVNNAQPSGLQGTVSASLKYKGRLYVATDQGLFQQTGTSLLNLKSAQGFVRITEQNIQATSLLLVENSLLAATNNGVLQFDGYSTRYLFNGYSKFLYRSRLDSNRIYIGMVNGLAAIRYENGNWLNEGAVAGFRGEVKSLAEDSSGILWVGTLNNGISSMDFRNNNRIQPEITLYDTSGGVLLSLQDNHVNTIGGRLFFSIRQLGLSRLAQGKEKKFIPFQDFGSQFADASRDIISIKEDNRGWVYITTIGRLRESKVEVFRLKPNGKDGYTTERMPFDRFLDSKPEDLYPDPEGILWFGNENGLVRFNSNNYVDSKPEFPALIREITINREQILFAGTFFDDDNKLMFNQPESMIPVLDYERGNTFRFHCALPNYDKHSENQYQYLLEGNDNKWSDWTNEAFKEYTNLLEGNYTFRVRAKNAHNEISKEAAYHFVIRPPIYRTFWAYLIYTLLGLLIVLGLVQVYTYRLKARKKELEQLVQERTHELENEKDQTEIQRQLLAQQKDELLDKNDALESSKSELTRQKNQLSIRNFMLQEQKEQLEVQKQEITQKHSELEEANFEISSKNAELENAYEEIRAINENLEDANQLLNVQKEEIELRAKELEEKNHELQIERADKLQAQKMAGLGEITPIVAHEINSPLSAIIGSLANVQQALSQLIRELPVSLNSLSEKAADQFWLAITVFEANPPTLTSREERKYVRDVEEWLEGLKFNNVEDTALRMVRTGLSQDMERFQELMNVAREHPAILELLFRIGTTWRQLYAMTKAADRASLIVTSLKSYVSQSNAEGEAVPTHVVETLEVVLTLYDYYLSQGIDLKLDLAPDLPIIQGFPQQMKQAWTNLIMSSVYAMKFKGELQIKAYLEKDSICVEMSDTGTPISKEKIDSVFKAEANARETEPAISLWVCYNVFVEQHGGQVVVTSNTDITRFTIMLPTSPA